MGAWVLISASWYEYTDFRPPNGQSPNLGGPTMECRLTAILAADVVGYSRLMGDDEEGTVACLRDRSGPCAAAQ